MSIPVKVLGSPQIVHPQAAFEECANLVGGNRHVAAPSGACFNHAMPPASASERERINTYLERYSKPHVIEKKKSARAASNASR
jgi:hypothetical protein